MTRLIPIALVLGLSGAAAAQTAPTAREVAAYEGLFKAAHGGEAMPPDPHRLVAEVDTALMEEILHVP